MSDRKLPRNLDNPIDNIIINYGRKLYPTYKKLNFTPNTLTTISFILSLISSFLFIKKYYLLSSICYIISYSYDAFDGNYARTYNMVTEFGDYYDHIKDLICGIIFLIIFIKYNKLSKITKHLSYFISFILLLLGCINLGIQEIYVSKHNSKNKSNYLSFLTKFTNNKFILKNKNILKYFGIGTFNVFVSLVILLNSF